MKSEPEVFSIDDLARVKVSQWDGVRNYQARNFMMNEMKPGDQVLIYHSNAEPSGVAGLATVKENASPDPTQFDPKSEYFDPKADTQQPRWFAVKIQFQKKFPKFLPLDKLRQQKPLHDMLLLKKGQRLSIQPVSKEEFDWICQIAQT